MGKATFKKAERLSGEKLIKELFERGSSFNLYPFRVSFLPHPKQDHPFNQILVTVSRHNFKRAVDRNAIKRRIREGYRLHKHELTASPKYLIAYIYIAKEILESDLIHRKLTQTFQYIISAEHEKKA